MPTLANTAAEMSDAAAKVVSLRHQLEKLLPELLPDASPNDRQALLDLRKQIESSAADLATAASWASIIANRAATLEGNLA